MTKQIAAMLLTLFALVACEKQASQTSPAGVVAETAVTLAAPSGDQILTLGGLLKIQPASDGESALVLNGKLTEVKGEQLGIVGLYRLPAIDYVLLSAAVGNAAEYHFILAVTSGGESKLLGEIGGSPESFRVSRIDDTQLELVNAATDGYVEVKQTWRLSPVLLKQVGEARSDPISQAMEMKSPATPLQFDKLAGKPAYMIFSNPQLQARLKSVLDSEVTVCARQFFEVAKSLRKTPRGSLETELHGSRAEMDQMGYLEVTEDAVSFVFACPANASRDEKYYVLSAPSLSDAAKHWIEEHKRVGSQFDYFDGSSWTHNKIAAQPVAQKTVQSSDSGRQVADVVAGALMCLDLQSMYRAMAIERANNPYADLPDSCVKARAFTTHVVKEWSPPLPHGTVIIEAGNQAVIIRRDDLVYRQ